MRQLNNVTNRMPLDRRGLSEYGRHYLLKGTDFEPMPTDDEIGLSKKVRLAGDLLQALDDDVDNG